MNRRAFACLFAILGAACGPMGPTEISFANGIPGASIENVRWETTSGNSYDQEIDVRLEPGQESESISLSEPDESATGRIHFELLADGRKVALVTGPEFRAQPGSSRTFTLTPATRAVNPLAP